MNARLAAVVAIAAGLGALAAWLPHAFLPGSGSAQTIVYSPAQGAVDALSPDGAYRARYYTASKEAGGDAVPTSVRIYSVEHLGSGRQLCWERDLGTADAKTASTETVRWSRNDTVRFADPARPGISLEVSVGTAHSTPAKGRP